MFIDRVTITIHGGKGGDGAISFRQNEGKPFGGPDGGNGGNGGDVYMKGIDDLTALQQFQYKKVWKADDGVAGKRKNLYGKNADDLIISVPVGTLILDESGKKLAEIHHKDESILIAQGGKGGRGNTEFKSATNQAPRIAEKGELGEEKIITLELRLIAQIGLIGLPNAGKSTLLSVLTSAKPKIGDYPFTTLEPNVGMMDGIMVADIPGLIEGASQGKGLGFTFLKHVEKTHLLVHCIDAESDDPVKSYQIVRAEFEKYNPELLAKPEVILLTKEDQVTPNDLRRKIRTFQKSKKQVLSVSAFDDQKIAKLRGMLLELEKQSTN